MRRYTLCLVMIVLLLIADACGINTVDGKTKEEWIAILESGDETERLAAISAVGKIGSEAADAVPYLIEILESEDETERMEAVIALGKMGPAASDALTPLFLAVEREYRIPCLEGALCYELSTAIVAIAQEKAVPMCEACFQFESSCLFACIFEILPQLGSDAVPGLVDILTTSDDEVSRKAASFALSFIAGDCGFGANEKLAVETLQSIAHSDPSDDVRENAQEALEKASQCRK